MVSKWDQIKSLFETAKATVKVRRIFVPDEVFGDRLQVCLTCPSMTTGDNGPKCTDCGCAVDVKVAMAGSKCPQGKWGVYSGRAVAVERQGGDLVTESVEVDGHFEIVPDDGDIG